MNVTKRIGNAYQADTIQWTNNTGADTVRNQVVLISTGTNAGLVGICEDAIEDGATGTLVVKLKARMPKEACAMSQGYCAQIATDGTSLTMGGTASGLYGVGMICDDQLSSASYVDVDINFGNHAFYVW